MNKLINKYSNENSYATKFLPNSNRIQIVSNRKINIFTICSAYSLTTSRFSYFVQIKFISHTFFFLLYIIITVKKLY